MAYRNPACYIDCAGGGGYSGGGGGSFDSGTNPLLASYLESGDGYVTIDPIGNTTVPEPVSLTLLAVGVAGLAVARRRRSSR